ncbi:helix-turn-helix domain-containing protein [Microbacterium caowuchunii]|uniref:Helix-turn-helix domain-containing protein n=1 Tax=Microbacterium caowuchunii TaxID=2614638 RepID=A0A5N0TL62_9MICO|nr:helix-turn-helix domain-containing protein [Microbacterium caowuchunii]KAA9135742.1 helix-turn-helix domain-containing protein [Microbacterium caowuchunii]
MTSTTPAPQPNDLLTTEEAAEVLRMTLEGLRWAIYAGTAPRSAKIGRRRLFRRADIEAYIEARFEAAA